MEPVLLFPSTRKHGLILTLAAVSETCVAAPSSLSLTHVSPLDRAKVPGRPRMPSKPRWLPHGRIPPNSFCFHSNSAVTERGARRRLRWAGGRWSGSVREKRSLHCDMLTTNSLSRPTVMRTFSKLHSVCTSLCERARRYTLMWKNHFRGNCCSLLLLSEWMTLDLTSGRNKIKRKVTSREEQQSVRILQSLHCHVFT